MMPGEYLCTSKALRTRREDLEAFARFIPEDDDLRGEFLKAIERLIATVENDAATFDRARDDQLSLIQKFQRH